MRVYQIYFDEKQLPLLEPDYIPFFNQYCTKYFESQVIHDLVMGGSHLGSDYFGVVSYKLREKIGHMKGDSWKNTKNIANTSVTEFTTEQFEIELYRHCPDAMSYQRHVSHDPIIVADSFHHGFRKYWNYIMDQIGYRWLPTNFEDVFYCNYFVAKTHIYERYVKEMLAPAMKVMDTMPELNGNANYPMPYPEHLNGKLKFDHWTFHAFICERMFSYFANIHNLDCKHY